MTTLIETLELDPADGKVFFGIAEARGMEAFVEHDGTEDTDKIAAMMYTKATMSPEHRAVFYVVQMHDDREAFYRSLIERMESMDDQAQEVAEHLNHEFLRHIQRDEDIKVTTPNEMSMFWAVIPGDDPHGWVALEDCEESMFDLIEKTSHILRDLIDENEETTDASE